MKTSFLWKAKKPWDCTRSTLQISTMFGASGDNYSALEHDGKRLRAKFAENNQDEESIK